MNSVENWKPIPGWEGYYSASDMGRIRSEPRVMELPCGQVRAYKGKVLSQYVDPDGRCMVNLKRGHHREGRRVHQLVLEAFIGPRPAGMEVCHWDDDSTNNRLDNLRYDTSLANKRDMARNGNGNQNYNKTHCVRGHEYTPENTYIRKNGNRDCRACWDLRPSRYEVQGNSNKDKTHCKNGHEFTPENTYRRKSGGRNCKTCVIARNAAKQSAQLEEVSRPHEERQ